MFKKACVTLGNSAPLSNAKEIWTVIAKSDKVCRGANRRGLIGNSLLFACYRTKIGITQDTVADALFIPSTEITKGRKIFKEIMITENREDIGNSIARKNNLLIIPPYDDPDVIAGQGTIGLEIIEQISKYDLFPDKVLVNSIFVVSLFLVFEISSSLL